MGLTVRQRREAQWSMEAAAYETAVLRGLMYYGNSDRPPVRDVAAALAGFARDVDEIKFAPYRESFAELAELVRGWFEREAAKGRELSPVRVSSTGFLIPPEGPVPGVWRFEDGRHVVKREEIFYPRNQYGEPIVGPAPERRLNYDTLEEAVLACDDDQAREARELNEAMESMGLPPDDAAELAAATQDFLDGMAADVPTESDSPSDDNPF